MDETVIGLVKVFRNSSVTLRTMKTVPCGRRRGGFSACNSAVYVHGCVPFAGVDSALMCPDKGTLGGAFCVSPWDLDHLEGVPLTNSH